MRRRESSRTDRQSCCVNPGGGIMTKSAGIVIGRLSKCDRKDFASTAPEVSGLTLYGSSIRDITSVTRSP
jgi:hypothetical protein